MPIPTLPNASLAQTNRAGDEESLLKEKLNACGEGTEELLESVKEVQAEARRSIENLKRACRSLQNLTQNVLDEEKEMQELINLLQERKTKLRRALSENKNVDAFVEELRVSNKHGKGVDNNGRPLFKRVTGRLLELTRKTKKKKKKMQTALLTKSTPDQSDLFSLDDTDGGMPSFENLNDSDEYIAQAEDRRAEHRPPRRKLGNNGARIEAEMSSSENFNDSAEYISRAEDRRAEHWPPRRKLGNYGAGFETEIPRFENSIGSEEYISQAEDPGVEHRSAMRKLCNCSGARFVSGIFKSLPILPVIHDGAPDDFELDLRISMHPKSQTVKEGSRVEFRCTVNKKKAGNLVYYWYKDGVAELGKNDCTLVLDPVELRHFGYYHCFVKYQDSFNEGVTSHRATLDIIPQSRKEMRHKRLSELDMDTTYKITTYLGRKNKFGLGDFKKVAAEFGMTPVQIITLENSDQPGNDVLDFILTTKPDLTVYSFCKPLKGDGFERREIVQELEDHFLVQEEADNVSTSSIYTTSSESQYYCEQKH